MRQGKHPCIRSIPTEGKRAIDTASRSSYPTTIATHNPEQTFSYDANGMQCRMDYIVQVNGNAMVAHYTSDPQTFGGLVFSTRRRVYRRYPEGTANRSLAFITIDIHNITINRDSFQR